MAYRFTPGCACCFCTGGFGDQHMQDADYTIGQVSTVLSPISWTSSRITTDPTKSECRDVQIVTRAGVQRHIIYHLLAGATRDPAVSTVHSVQLAIDVKLVSGTDAVWGMIIRQGGFIWSTQFVGTFLTSWESKVLTNLAGAGWLRNCQSGFGSPSFTSGVMEFGFFFGSDTTTSTSMDARFANVCITLT